MGEFKKGIQGDIYNQNIYIGSEQYANKVVTKKDLDDLFQNNDPPPATAISYDNSTSGLAATNVKTAIDEISSEKLDKVTAHWEIKNATANFEINEVGGSNMIKIYEIPVDPGSLGKAVKVNIAATTTIEELEFGGW